MSWTLRSRSRSRRRRFDVARRACWFEMTTDGRKKILGWLWDRLGCWVRVGGFQGLCCLAKDVVSKCWQPLDELEWMPFRFCTRLAATLHTLDLLDEALHFSPAWFIFEPWRRPISS